MKTRNFKFDYRPSSGHQNLSHRQRNLGSVWRRLGAKVTVVEFLDQLLPGMDGEVRKGGQDLQEESLPINRTTLLIRRSSLYGS